MRVSRMLCAGCGTPAEDAQPFRCPRAGHGDVDHVFVRVLDAASIDFPSSNEANPFLRYRTLFHSYDVARVRGMPDADYCGIVQQLDEAIARVDGHGFRTTRFTPGAGPQAALWIKDETDDVSGSHKARHLMGIMLYLRVLEALGLATQPHPPLAIASCGNAALAAAVVARAAGRTLRVFIPADASASVVRRLADLGAEINVCHRQAGVPGDPCYAAFRQAVSDGALPFCCQGNENGLAIEGGSTIGYEMISQRVDLDRIVIQVGGGALATSIIRSFAEGVGLGVAARLPRMHTVQTEAAYPLKRAYDRFVEGCAGAGPTQLAGLDERTQLRYMATHRSEFMWPWESVPHSLAHGILDDETYDWLAVVKGMLVSGGWPLVVSEAELAEAYRVARETTGIHVDHTGAAGYAGYRQLLDRRELAPDEEVAVIFSGRERD